MKRVVASCVLMLVMCCQLMAQQLPDPTLNRDFTAQVKSMEEFLLRFNGQQEEPSQTTHSSRTEQLLSLFDHRMSHENLSDSAFRALLCDFVSAVESSGVVLQMADAQIYADAVVVTKICGRQTRIHLVLQLQSYKGDRHRWAIVGVRGLAEGGTIDLQHFYPISPVDHETQFMSLRDVFRYNQREMMGYRGENTEVDELSAFLALGMTGQVSIEYTDKLTMHCLQVPGYIFEIDEFGRRGTNSGWLISRLTKANENQKTEYLTKLLRK